MGRLRYIKVAIMAECAALFLMSLFLYEKQKRILPAAVITETKGQQDSGEETAQPKSDYIKWVEFHVPEEILTAAYKLDVETYEEDIHLQWIDLLSYVAARHGGEFPAGTGRELSEVAEKLRSGETTMEKLTEDMQYFSYYKQAYSAILGGFVGEYKIQKRDDDGRLRWESCYGLKAFSPIAKGFYYEDYDDFGASRSYGYARSHLGHDMMGQVGTPIEIICRKPAH